MSVVQTYSSVNVTDSSDTGSLSSYLTSNQPSSVILNPNTNTYTPDWSSSPYLVITPVVSYNGTQLQLNATGLTITYTRKDGSNNATALTTGETVSGNILTVNANKLAGSTSGILTYICNISYIDPSANIPITAQNTLTYSLISNASEIKYAYITGENTFLYNSSRTIVGSSTITLKADVQSVAITKWQYLNSSGDYVDFPTTHNQSISGTTLVVYATESNIWVNGRTATIKLVTSDPNVYDIHQIQKIYDGASGTSTVSIVLSNQSHYVPCDSNGNVLSWNGASTRVYIYEGGQDVTSSWNITATPGTGLTGTFSNNVFTPSGLTNDVGYVDFSCTRSGYSNLSSRYTITKTRTGADGQSAVIYELVPNTYVLNLNEDNIFSPNSVTFSGSTKTGASMVRAVYSGRFIIAESTDGTAYTNKYTSSSDESSKVYTPSSPSVQIIRARLYASGGTSTLLDEQTVVVTRDGTSGEDGSPGLSMNIVNTQDVIACTEGGLVAAGQNLTIPFYAYLGITRIPVTATITTTLPSGMSVTSNTAGTTLANGQLVLHVDKNATLGNASTLKGTISIKLSSASGELTTTYIWTKNLKGADGQAANILQIYSEDGGVIKNSTGSTTLKIRYMHGGSQVTPTSIQWYKYQSGNYVAISGATSTSLVVTAQMVDDLAFFKCTATYSGSSCDAFYTVDDLQDQVTAVVMASVREFKNGEGCGAVYTRLYRGNQEIDPLKANTFSTIAPSTPHSGDYYYYVNPNEKTVTLKRYNGSTWENAAEGYTYTYKYYRVDRAGTSLDTSSPYRTARCIYVDPSIVVDIMQFVCEVEE